jgi:formate hydrogenlyase subunit 4
MLELDAKRRANIMELKAISFFLLLSLLLNIGLGYFSEITG